MLEDSWQILTESKNLHTATMEISGSINEAAASAEQINAAVAVLHDISEENKNSTAALEKEVAQFKIAS
jgi:methyl-accepting chemotaxis protein